MKIVLFNPAPRSGWQAQRRVELPLNLLCPATAVVAEGYSVRIIDEYASLNWRQDLEDAIREKPLCFGVTSMTGPQILHALAACRLVRRRHPDVPIVWGGIHASLLPAQTLDNPYVDIVVEGEGEITFPELVKALDSKSPLRDVKGIWFKENGAPLHTGKRKFFDIDRQPPLAYDLVNMDNYRRRLFGIDHVSFNSSRGCTNRCAFCWDPTMHRRKWRAMRPDTVMGHLERLVRDYGIRGFLFTDDHFFIDLDRARRILEEIVRADLDISISKLQIRADVLLNMDRDFMDLLVRAGVKRLTVGAESGSQRLLDLMKKDLKVETIIEANRRLIPYPIVPIFLFMMGLPTETPEDLEKSVKLAVKLTDENKKAVKTFNIYTPYPGTELYRMCVEAGMKEPESLEEWAPFNFRNIPRESAWYEPRMRRLIRGLDFPLMFLGKGHFVTPYKKTHPAVVLLSKLYYPIARYRVQNLDVRFPVESALVRRMGLFGRQD